ncbi:MAG: hypothetical protein KAI79_12820 [Bacteroidales bacterium]|nr:hypothetical protein [Bacteroidales bacterium]
MSNRSRLEKLEAKIHTGEEIIFETKTLQKMQAKLKLENKPTRPFNLKEIQKRMSAIS